MHGLLVSRPRPGTPGRRTRTVRARPPRPAHRAPLRPAVRPAPRRTHAHRRRAPSVSKPHKVRPAPRRAHPLFNTHSLLLTALLTAYPWAARMCCRSVKSVTGTRRSIQVISSSAPPSPASTLSIFPLSRSDDMSDSSSRSASPPLPPPCRHTHPYTSHHTKQRHAFAHTPHILKPDTGNPTLHLPWPALAHAYSNTSCTLFMTSRKPCAALGGVVGGGPDAASCDGNSESTDLILPLAPCKVSEKIVCH
jgi:hypothetical protein